MTTATTARPDAEQELGAEKLAHVLHTLIDLAPFKTEADRDEAHRLVTDVSTVSRSAAADALLDPEAYAAAKAEGAYDEPEPPPAPVDPRDAEIAKLRAELDQRDAAASDARDAELARLRDESARKQPGSPTAAGDSGGTTGTSSPVTPGPSGGPSDPTPPVTGATSGP